MTLTLESEFYVYLIVGSLISVSLALGGYISESMASKEGISLSRSRLIGLGCTGLLWIGVYFVSSTMVKSVWKLDLKEDEVVLYQIGRSGLAFPKSDLTRVIEHRDGTEKKNSYLEIRMLRGQSYETGIINASEVPAFKQKIESWWGKEIEIGRR